MTTKEIAGVVGKAERTVHGWVEKTSAKVAEVSAKVAKAKATSKAADYTEKEALLIIEEGMGKDVADVYRTNALLSKGQRQTPEIRKLSALDQLRLMVNAMEENERRQIETEHRVKLLEDRTKTEGHEYYTITAFASVRGVQMPHQKANMYGRKAAKLSREYDYEVSKAYSEVWGEVNSYHVDILTLVFEE